MGVPIATIVTTKVPRRAKNARRRTLVWFRMMTNNKQQQPRRFLEENLQGKLRVVRFAGADAG